MVPRVFVSSTYYDLKHVRERLEKFIENYGFEPVLFESDKVTYQHGKPIDYSAYKEVVLCHVMVLIIGGRYGTSITSSNEEIDRKRYDEDYISITRREFETSLSQNIPVFVFVDKNVYSDYETYKENQDFFDDLYSESTSKKSVSKKFKFAHVDHINIFKFLDIVKVKPIKAFDRIEQIEGYLKSQFSGLFYLYLEDLKKQSTDNIILDTISELNNITLRMNEMLNSVGKEILGKDKHEYERVIESQFSILLDFYSEKFNSSIEFEKEYEKEEIETMDLQKVVEIIYNDALLIEIPKMEKWDKWDEYMSFNKATDNRIFLDIKNKILQIDYRIILKRLSYRNLNQELKQKVLSFLKTEDDKQQLFNRLIKSVKYHLRDLPF